MNQRAIYATAAGRQMAAVNEAELIRLVANNPTVNINNVRPLPEIIEAIIGRWRQNHPGRRFDAQQSTARSPAGSSTTFATSSATTTPSLNSCR